MPAAKKKAETRTKASVNRTPRSATVRAKETRNTPWIPPTLLETPEAPAGYKYRWIRESTFNEADKGNMSRRIREGFEVVRPEELEEVGHFHAPRIDEGRHAGFVGVGGLILAKIPLEIVEQREAYFNAQTSGQLEAIDAEMGKVSHSAMPIGKPSRKTRVSFGNPENIGGADDDQD